jgi:hypothetical protein
MACAFFELINEPLEDQGNPYFCINFNYAD